MAKIKNRQSNQISNNINSNISNNKKDLKILVIEADQMTQEVIKLMLAKDNSDDIDIAGTGKEALKLLSRKKYDVIFMEIGLPDMTGDDIAKKIRTSNNHINQETPIAALTVNDAESIKAKCFKAGINYFFVKPIYLDKLQQLLEKLR